MLELLRLPEMEETIRDLPGYEDSYKISSKGVVYSKERRVPSGNGTRLIREKKLTGSMNNRKDSLNYSISHLGVAKKVSIHGLLYATFPDGYPAVESLPGEVWKDHHEFEYYQVSNLGRVKRLPRPMRSTALDYNVPERLISVISVEGYPTVSLYCHKTGKLKCVALNHLVYEAFIGPIRSRELLIPIDGNAMNCAVSNLKRNKFRRYRSVKIN